MLRDWNSYCRVAPSTFERHGNLLIITNDTPESQGFWYAWWDEPVKPGQKFQVFGTHNGGHIAALFFRSDKDFMHSVEVAPGEVFEIPEEATVLRIDCRLWKEQGKAIFDNVHIIEYAEPQEEEGPPVLPIPQPDLMQKHHVTGYKWGRNVFVMVHGDEPMVPPDWGDAYEVKGYQHGRRLDLEIGNMITAEEPADNKES